MILLDTSYLIALAIPRDGLHARALAWSEYLPERFLVTEYVLWETLNALSAPSNREMGHVAIEGIRANPQIEVRPASQRLFDEGLAMHARMHDKAWSMTDCVSFAVMRESNIAEALTYDRHFEQAGFRALLREDPPI